MAERGFTEGYVAMLLEHGAELGALNLIQNRIHRGDAVYLRMISCGALPPQCCALHLHIKHYMIRKCI